VIGHVDLLVNAGHVREVDEGEVVRYEASADTATDELGDVVGGGEPAPKPANR
jgi:hypothetical protein